MKTAIFGITTALLSTASFAQTSASNSASQGLQSPDTFIDGTPRPGSGKAGGAPPNRADSYHIKYASAARAYRDVDLTQDNRTATGICLGTYEHRTLQVAYSLKDLEDSMCRGENGGDLIEVHVTQKSAPGVIGCQQILPFYVAVRDKLISELPGAIDLLGDSIDDQAALVNMRNDVEVAQVDVHNVQQFCHDLENYVRVSRSIFHAYTSAWAEIKFGDGTLPRRKLRSGKKITHTDVILQALGSIEHEPQVALGLME